MPDYRVRRATLDDLDVLVHHRIAMFEEMGVPLQRHTVSGAFRAWLQEMMPAGIYHAWLVEEQSIVVAGGGLTVLPWPPGPHNVDGRVGFVYNVYTEPARRHRGVARLVMDAIHAWSRDQRLESIVLNASRFGQPLYESLGYAPTTSPMMFLSLK